MNVNTDDPNDVHLKKAQLHKMYQKLSFIQAKKDGDDELALKIGTKIKNELVR